LEKTVNGAKDLALPVTSKLKEVARAFMEFVNERNELVHGHIYSDAGVTQQLIYLGRHKTRTWSIAEIDDLAHRFETLRSSFAIS